MRNLLYRRYESALKRRALGGDMTGAGYTQLAGIGTGLIDDAYKPNQYGVQPAGATIGKSVLSDAATGAAIGSVIPGVGTAIGAVGGAAYGLVSGYLKSKGNNAKENNAKNQIAMNTYGQQTKMSNAVLGADPSLATGNIGEQYFSKGGTIHIKAGHKGRFTAYKEHTGKTTEEALHSKNAHVRQMANFARNSSHWKKEDGGIMPTNVVNGLPVTYGKNDPSTVNRTPLNDLITSGGTAKKLSSDNALIIGKSHADGGIQVPELDTEVEGGETTLNNFVFSKKLGFADAHKPIARAKGIIEQKPRTPERATSMRLLMAKEQKLAENQEQFKQQNGLK